MKLDEFVFVMDNSLSSVRYGICKMNGYNIYVEIFNDDIMTYHINIFKDNEQQLMTFGTWEEVLVEIRRIIYE